MDHGACYTTAPQLEPRLNRSGDLPGDCPQIVRHQRRIASLRDSETHWARDLRRGDGIGTSIESSALLRRPLPAPQRPAERSLRRAAA
jgi:hypothetical protein